MLPNRFHSIPVSDYSLLDRITKGEHFALEQGAVTHKVASLPTYGEAGLKLKDSHTKIAIRARPPVFMIHYTSPAAWVFLSPWGIRTPEHPPPLVPPDTSLTRCQWQPRVTRQNSCRLHLLFHNKSIWHKLQWMSLLSVKIAVQFDYLVLCILRAALHD